MGGSWEVVMKFVLSILLLIQSFFLLSQESKLIEIEMKFIKEGKEVDLIAENAQVYFVCGTPEQKAIFKPKIIESSFSMPDLCGYNKGHILLKVGGEIFGFGYGNINFTQNMRLVFGFDKRPYDKEYYLDAANQKETKGMVYIEFHPLEEGEGTVTAINILDFKTYLQEAEKLLE